MTAKPIAMQATATTPVSGPCAWRIMRAFRNPWLSATMIVETAMRPSVHRTAPSSNRPRRELTAAPPPRPDTRGRAPSR